MQNNKTDRPEADQEAPLPEAEDDFEVERADKAEARGVFMRPKTMLGNSYRGRK